MNWNVLAVRFYLTMLTSQGVQGNLRCNRCRSGRRDDEQGFTLIELLIVVAIIAILAAILIPNFLRARAQSQLSATKGNMKNAATALESYYVDNSTYPATLPQLSPGIYRSRSQ